ncbi:thermonuclease family protein [bacterium]|nr:thermonuclease family protein [bacterium]
MRLGKPVRIACLIFALFSVMTGCKRELDKDGGYYDEKTHTYKYVKPRRRGFTDASQQVFAPRPGETQTISCTVARIGEDAKSVWIRIEERKPYMILASSLSGSNRDDKTKTLLLNLSYVSPKASVNGSRRFRQQWAKYVIQTLGNELQNRNVLAEINYEERSRRLTGSLLHTVKTKDGDRVRNVNLWMVQQGLSFYFIDRGKSPLDKEFMQAQQLARQQKLGVWQY